MTKPSRLDERRLVAARLPLDGLPLAPGELAKLSILDPLYTAVGLDLEQRGVIEAAVRGIRTGAPLDRAGGSR